MTVTNIDTARPEIQTAWYLFDDEAEAHMFVAGVKEDLAEQEFFDFVDSNVAYISSDGNWKASVDYVDRTPEPDEAA